MNLFDKSLKELNLPGLLSLSLEASVKDALDLFLSQSIGAIGIVDAKGILAGILSERDLVLRSEPHELADWAEMKITRLMTPKVKTVACEQSIAEAMHMMSRMEFRHLPVKDGSQYLMLSARDILDLVIEHYRPLCEKFGTLTEWETQIGHIHEEDYVFHGQKDALETGSFLFAVMKEIGGSDMLKVDGALPVRELWGAMKAAHLPVAAVVSWSTLLKGIITERDLLTKIFAHGVEALDWPAHKIMTERPHSMLVKHHLVYALNNMSSFHYRNILVVDEDRFPVRIAELIHFLKFFSRVLQDSNPED